MKPKEQFLTIKAAAGIYGISGDILETLIKSNGIKPAYKSQVGFAPERVFYSKDAIGDVLKYLSVKEVI